MGSRFREASAASISSSYGCTTGQSLQVGHIGRTMPGRSKSATTCRGHNIVIGETSLEIKLVLAVLATWRITHLLANEDGPADVIARLRARLGDGFAGKLMDCFYCLSLWVAAPAALFVCGKPPDLPLTWLALSGAACLLERMSREPAVIQPIPQTKEGDWDHGMLRSETNGAQERSIADDNAERRATRAE